jgi:tRNA uridine 5-carboxymethylaminomethyl modification enzyme
VNLERLAMIWPDLKGIAPDVAEQLEIDAHYAGYLDRQEDDIAAFRRDESLIIPERLDYLTIHGLSTECRTKLAQVRPRTLGQASRIDGVTPAALTLVLAAIRHASAAHAPRG